MRVLDQGAHSADLTNEEYRKLNGITSTDLRRFQKAPLLLQYPPAQKSSPARNIGLAAHMKFSQDKKLESTFGQAMHDGRFKEGKAERAHALEHGITLLKQEDWNGAMGAAQAARKLFATWLQRNADEDCECVYEVPIVAMHHDTGLVIKSRPDVAVYTEDGVYIFDLKTTTDATARGFRKQAGNDGYITQVAHYCEVQAAHHPDKPILGAEIIAVETNVPYAGAIHHIDSEALVMERMSCHESYSQLRICEETGVWPNIQPATLYGDSDVVKAKHIDARVRRAMHLVKSGMPVSKAANLCEITRHKLRYQLQKNPLNI